MTGKTLKTTQETKDIVDAIFETENVGTTTRSTRNKKQESEGDKNNEEETIENIQTLLDTESKLKKSVTESAKKPEGNIPKITEKVDNSGVFISINSKDDCETLEGEESSEHAVNPLEANEGTQEIPQVMLDQLDLKKFPNLKINEESSVQTTRTPIKGAKKNSNLLSEIHKRMEMRKAKQTKSQDDPHMADKEEGVTPRRLRGGPKKANDQDKDDEEMVTLEETTRRVRGRPKKANHQDKDDDDEEEEIVTPEETPHRGRGRPRKVNKTPFTPQTKQKAEPVSKKEQGTFKVEKKADTEEEDNYEDEAEVPLLSRSRSARKIKMTDKFKSFVAQEKNIKTLLSENEGTRLPEVKSKVLSTPKNQSTPKIKPKSEIQLKLKRKKESSEGEEEVGEEEEEGEEEITSDVDLKENRLRKRKLSKKPDVEKREKTKSPKKRPKKELVSESDLSDFYDEVDDEDMDPDFNESDPGTDASVLSDVELSFEQRSTIGTRTVLELMRDVFHLMPTWNVHILPNTNTFCIAQVIRGVNGVPMLKKCIEMDHNFNVKVFVHQIHYKKYDGVYDSEDHLIELLQLVDSM